jgi:hypothetical protein
MSDRLPAGLYESLVTLGLRDAIDEVQSDGWSADIEQIDEALLADLFADHVRQAAHRSIASIRGDGGAQLAAQVDLVNRLLAVLREAGATNAVIDADVVATQGEILRQGRLPSL